MYVISGNVLNATKSNFTVGKTVEMAAVLPQHQICYKLSKKPKKIYKHVFVFC